MTNHKHTLLWALLPLFWLSFAGCKSTGKAAEENRDRSRDTMNIATVSGQEVYDRPVTNVVEMLRGRVPGVQVIPAAGGYQIRIRGVNSIQGDNEPLFVLDGVPLIKEANGTFLLMVNPYDVEDIRVLKGPDAMALYGFRGNNGVIEIKTRRK
ncbi:MAG TPA: TonB-dependent receptor plug domain-containing protein [Rhodothermales bacterium]|nr:TonB-dependent receptor plug domain-containing protein [Rhodothermales bacterium]HRR09771.1 TonB-dependent receptor plug domain-containing protein [Rhodothermales bacterium]